MKFIYSARNDKSQVVNGLLEAATQEAALAALQRAGLVVIKLGKKPAEPWYLKFFGFLQKASLKDLSIFTRQLATLLGAQVSIVESLETVARQTANPVIKETVLEMGADIQAGLSFSDALSKHGHIFSPFFINMIRASEFIGKLDEALIYLADYYETQENINKKVKNAMIYPAFVVGLFIVVIIIMVTIVVPQLSRVILESGVEFADLPLMTRILFSVGDFFTRYYVLALGFVVIITVLLVRYFGSEEGQMFLSTLFLKVPIVGPFLKRLYISRFTETFSVLLNGAIPVAQSLEISGDVIGSLHYQNVIYGIADGVRQGQLISDMLSQYPDYFPPLVAQMIAIGEKTGRLEELLRKVAQFYNRELEALVNSLTEIIQPVLIVIIGILIGGLIAAIILPIYQIAQQF
jgi:type IV pilus assembly protein PilC